MHIDIYRKLQSEVSMMGEIHVDGQYESDCIEPHSYSPIHPGHPCVKAGGPYKVRLSLSPHMHIVTPEVLNVPDREYIRIHPANEAKELLGCTAPGWRYAPVKPDWVSDSKKAFAELMVLLKTAPEGTVTITYHDIM